jgi:hypothetical protein
MKLRITNSLKLIALLIFSVELLTPLLLPAEHALDKNSMSDHLVSAATGPNQLFYLLAEELDSNEERGEGHKELTTPFPIDLFLVFNFQLETENSLLELAQGTFESFTVKSRLFILNCRLLI